MNVAYTNDSLSAVGFISFVGFDTSIGDSGNQVQLKLHSSQKTEIAKGSLIWSPGTEYGGIIQDIQSKLETDGQRYVYYSGPSWSGRLSQRIVCPPTGADHYTLEGEANEALNTLMEYLGLGYLFQAPEGNSGITLNSDLDRFADGYSALRKAAAENDCRLSMKYDNTAKKVIIQFVKRETHGNYTSDNSPISVTVGSPVNHLVCAGTGELQDRSVVHLYIDKDGNVSQTQYYKGADEISTLYENTSADKDKLIEEGTSKLLEYQEVNQVEISVEDGSEDLYPLDDVIVGFDFVTGIKASSTITKKVVSVDAQGFESYRYEAADVRSSSGSTLSPEVSGGSGDGATYTAGYGIDITDNKISADVGTEELNEVNQVAQAANTNASNAAAEAAKALSNANNAQTTSDAKVGTIKANSPLDAKRTEDEVSLSHTNSGVSAGVYGATDNKSADWGETVTVGARMSVNATGHVTNAQGRTVTLPGNTATKDTKGLMSASDKAKLDGVGQGANKTTVDSSLSSTSTNPVQNKTIKSELDNKANSEHNHNADDITSGVLSISRGGLGGETATESLYNLFDGIDFPVTGQSGNIYMLALNPKGSETTSCIAYVTDSVLWQRIYEAIKQYVGPSDVGALSETGNAKSASKLQSKRTITITGAVNGSARFDGSQDISITVTGDSEAAGFLAAHPIGSIYATSNPTDPGVTYGGVWKALASADSFKWLRVK